MEPVASSTPFRRWPPWARVLALHAALLYVPFVWLLVIEGHGSHSGWWLARYPILPGLPALYPVRQWIGDTPFNEHAGMIVLTLVLLAVPTWWARRGARRRVLVTGIALGLYGLWLGFASHAVFVA